MELIYFKENKMITSWETQNFSFAYIIFLSDELQHGFSMDAKEFLPAGGSYHNGVFSETIVFSRDEKNKMDC